MKEKKENLENLVVIFAHPDDESMFFLPTLKNLQKTCRLHFLCLSSGNFEGLGNIRKWELQRAAKCIGNVSSISIIEDERLQDGMKTVWDPVVIANHIGKAINQIGLEEDGDIVLLTFDEGGVSQHPNHIATYFGVRLAKFELMS